MQTRQFSDYSLFALLVSFGTIVLGMIVAVWLVWHGIAAVITVHFTPRFHGGAAVLAGIFLILLGLSFALTCLHFPPIRARLPMWLRFSPWWLFAASMLFYAIACYIPRA